MTILVFGIAINPVLQASYGVMVSSSSNSELSHQNMFGLVKGILQFKQDYQTSDASLFCGTDVPVPKVESEVRQNNKATINVDSNPDDFFIVLGEKNSDTFYYMHVAPPNFARTSTEAPSYIVILEQDSDDQNLYGSIYGLHQNFDNSALVLESDTEYSHNAVISSEDYLYRKYLVNSSKEEAIDYSPRLEPGKYHLDVILFQSDLPQWVDHSRCAYSLEWKFSVDKSGKITTDTPHLEIGVVSDITRNFSPLKQHKIGVGPNFIQCNNDLVVIGNRNGPDVEPACVTPDTASKLIGRGWESYL